jgi:uncharacterized protein YeaO (DUF488 family)
MKVKVKRVYEEPSENDGQRILVDRIWPRGLTKEAAQIDLWLKSIAPSNDLRKWFSHDPQKWKIFRKKYFGELDENQDVVNDLVTQVKKHNSTLVYAARNVQQNNAIALRDYLESRI